MSQASPPSPAEAAAELLRRQRARIDSGTHREYVSGLKLYRHSRFIHDKLNLLKPGCGKRYMFFLPPGSAKTLDISHHFPAHYLSRYPEYPIIGATHTDKFAEQNGRRVRNIIMSDEHKVLFPDIAVKDDSSAAARWELTNNAMYMGFGVGATVVGRRAGGIIMDDVVAGIAAADSEADRNAVWDWYGADLATRLVPGGWIILVMTRYHPDDIAGRLLASAGGKYGDKWEVFSMPAIAKEKDILGRKPGEALWPEWQDADELQRIKHQPSMTARMWAALYQQEPVVEGGNLVKRDFVQIWKERSPPECSMILQTWDTALSKQKAAAYSVCQTWGIFTSPLDNQPAVILLSRWRERREYYDLRKMAMRLYHNYLDDRFDMPMSSPSRMNPDILLIEDAPAGKPLISDMRAAGINALAFSAQKYGDKDARFRLTLDLYENKRVWVPGQPPHFTQPRRFADEWLNSITSFPAVDSRDDADATSQALIWIKKNGWVQHTDNPPPPEKPWREWDGAQREAFYG